MEYGEIRTMEGDTIISPASPRLRVRIDPTLIYLGDLQYLLHQTNRVQEFVFIDVNSLGHVTRIMLVQFQGFLESKVGKYDHPVHQTVRLSGQEYLYDVFFINLPEYIAAHPESEIARAADYIRQRAYTLSGDVVYQRFLRLVDAENRNQMIIAYMERNEDQALTTEAIQKDKAAAKLLLERALNRFSILK